MKFKIILLFSIGIILFTSSCENIETKSARHRKRADQYIKNSEYNKAQIELKNLLQMDPDNDSVYCELGDIYLRLKDDEHAVDAFQRAVKINPDNLKARLRMGQIYLILSHTREARNTAMFLLEKMPEDIDTLHLFASVQEQEKNYDAALKTLEKAAMIDPQNAVTYLFMAHINYEKGDLRAAEEKYKHAISLSPDSPMAYMGLTRLYGSQEEWIKVESTLKSMIQNSDQKDKYLIQLGFFYESKNRLAEAEKAFISATEAAPPGDVETLAALGEFYIRRENYQRATAVFEDALKIQKDNPDILQKYAYIKFKLNDLDESDVITDMILQKHENHVEANLLKSRILFEKKDYSNALYYIETAIKEKPDKAMAYYLKAMCILNGGANASPQDELLKVASGHTGDTQLWEKELAMNSLVKALELAPDYLPARVNLAELYIQTNNFDLAKKEIDEALKQSPDDLTVQILSGSLKMIKSDYRDAEMIFTGIMENHPEFPPVYVKTGLLYMKTKKYVQAEEMFLKALELNPEQFDALRFLVAVQLHNKTYSRAISFCDSLSKRIKKSPVSLAQIDYVKGIVFIAEGDIFSAKKLLNSSIKNDPKFVAPHLALSELFLKENNKKQAKYHYETALQTDPKNITALMELGKIYSSENKLDTAEEYYRKVLNINPEHAYAANNLAYTLVEKDINLFDAQKLAEMAKSKRPRDPVISDTLGWIYFKRGLVAEAHKELVKSLEINPKDALANYHLGWIYYDRKEYDKARAQMKKALELDPGFPGADEAKSILGKQ